MEILSAYIPVDRRHALAGNGSLPECCRGSALFADISGFTPLTEALTRTLGPRRGAEELTAHLNTVYHALIHQVDRFGGSVIGFAGDAITCWFDEDDGLRAVTCALAMQSSIAQFAKIELAAGEPVALAVKIGIAYGQARRFLVGDPSVQLLDVLAGETLARMAIAGQLARRGVTVIAPEVFENLGDKIKVLDLRNHPDHTERFVVIGSCEPAASESPWPSIPELGFEKARPWLLRPVYDRLIAGQGEFLTELRPAVAVFVKFEGIDYDNDLRAGEKLNRYVSWVQGVTARYGGFLVDVAVGDKGSYLYASFGAPIAHENDAWRALTTAHEIVRPPTECAFVNSTRIGVSSGTMRTGAYGGATRRTYGVLGDEVNLAARLMEAAAPGQILVSGRLRKVVADSFEWQQQPPLRAKGKAEPIDVSALIGPLRRRGGKISQVQYSLELIGRSRELLIIENSLKGALAGLSQTLCLSAEAGIGKSRLVAEAVRIAEGLGFKCLIGECQSHGTHTGYLAWQSIWQELLNVDPSAPLEIQVRAVQNQLGLIDPILEARLPLLGAVLNLAIPDNEITAPLEARLRKASLEALLLECLRHIARHSPLFIVIEDAHWIDALSRDLLDLLVRSISKEPVVFVFTQRPREKGHSELQGFEPLPNFTVIALEGFTDNEAARLIQLKLARLFDFTEATPPVLAGRLIARAAGNPFYLEELLNFLKDQDVDFRDPDAVERLELPASLHSLVLSRIDRLTETQQSAMKVASVIGRLFPAALVWGIQPDADRQPILEDLNALSLADLTAVDRPEPELAYIFKHVVTQEVTYESLPVATRSKLHEKIGLCLESSAGQRPEQQINLLAFHFDRSPNLARRRQYLRMAGELAQANYANTDAISYYERVLPLLDRGEQMEILLKLGKVRELTGEWEQSGSCYQRALEVAESVADHLSKARCQASMGDLLRKQGLFSEAAEWLAAARSAFEAIGSPAGVGQALHALGTVEAMRGNYPSAKSYYEQSLSLREALGEHAQIASLLSNLGIIARFSGDYGKARQLMEQSLEIRRRVADRWAIANSLNNLGVLLRDIGELDAARKLLEESLVLNRQVGDRWAIANTLSSLGEVAIDQRDWPATREFLGDSLSINMELGDRTAVAFVLECFAVINAARLEPSLALRLAGAAAGLRAAIGSPLSPAEQQRLDKNLEPARASISAEQASEFYEQGKSLSLDAAIAAAAQGGI